MDNLSVASDAGSAHDPADAGPTSDDAGSRSDATATTDGDASNTAGGTGKVSVSQSRQPFSGLGGGVLGNFGFDYDPDFGAPNPALKCATSSVGSCRIQECDVVSLPQDGGFPVVPSAGNITVKGGKLGPTGVTLTPNAWGAYQGEPVLSQLFASEDTLTLEATGAEVPAFSGQSVKAPSDIQVTAPAFSNLGSTKFPRDSDLDVVWTGASFGDVLVTVTSVHMRVRAVTLSCTFQGSSGSATIPTTALGKLDRVDGNTITGAIGILPRTEARFNAGAWNIAFRVTAMGNGGFYTVTN